MFVFACSAASDSRLHQMICRNTNVNHIHLRKRDGMPAPCNAWLLIVQKCIDGCPGACMSSLDTRCRCLCQQDKTSCAWKHLGLGNSFEVHRGSHHVTLSLMRAGAQWRCEVELWWICRRKHETWSVCAFGFGSDLQVAPSRFTWSWRLLMMKHARLCLMLRHEISYR
jgi:hypothetical protein